MFQRILLALDSGDAGAVAASLTVALARKCGATVQVVHVDRRGSAQAADVVTEVLRDLHAAGVSAAGITYRTTGFDLPYAISDFAEQYRADVIVVGSRRRRRLSPVLHRGMRERIARRTCLPIVTAPAPLRVVEHDPNLVRLVPELSGSVRSPSEWSTDG